MSSARQEGAQGKGYIPLHDRQLPPRNPKMPPSPRYAPNVDDEREERAETSRKRPRTEERQMRAPEPSVGSGIPPSFFGIAPRNEFTATIGDWLLKTCYGRSNVEIEIKLGVLVERDSRNTVRMAIPSLSESIIPPEYVRGHAFVSDMAAVQHAHFNMLLNESTADSQQSPFPIRYTHTYNTDSFYEVPGQGKIRVTTDQKGNVVDVVNKVRVGDLNVRSPRQLFDWRISVSCETPCDMPQGKPIMRRHKDRMSYRHQICQVDLTKVTLKDAPQQPVTYEVEVEVIDPQILLSEGAKEFRGEPNVFDDALQSVLDSVRMLVKNGVPAR